MLELKKVSKTFNPGTVNEKKALIDLSLTLEDGDFVTIVGSNGAGKSTLFNAIAGTFLPDKGKILLDGHDITFMRMVPGTAYDISLRSMVPLDVDGSLLVGVLAAVLREAHGERDAPDLLCQQVLLVEEEDE